MTVGLQVVKSRAHATRPRVILVVMAGVMILGSVPAAHADEDTDKMAITDRLQQWTRAFNARDGVGVCDIFASDLVSTVPGALNAGRTAVCERLAALLAEPSLRLRYRLDIEEIIVSGDIAVVRLSWTLTSEKDGKAKDDLETGMDLFRRQADGRWSIIRFVAFSTSP